MPGKAKVGKIKSFSGAKKRFKRTGKGRFAHDKPSHNHLLQQKSKKSKRQFGHTMLANPAFDKALRRMLPNT